MADDINQAIKDEQKLGFWDKALEDSKSIEAGQCIKPRPYVQLLMPRREWPCFIIFHRWTKWDARRFEIYHDQTNNLVAEGVKQERMCKKCGRVQMKTEVMRF